MRARRFLSSGASVGISAALVAAPFVIAFGKVGERAIFGVFASDAMYYLAVAKNTVAKGFLTFNQETVTNGFQPLWQYILVFFNALFRPSLETQLFLGFGLNLLFVALGIAALASGVSSWLDRGAALTLPFFLLPGAFALFFEPARGHWSPDPALQYSFSSWAFVNGMESGVSVLALGLFVMTVLGRLARAPSGASSVEIFSLWPRVWLAMFVLTRLDDAFLVMGVGLAVLAFDDGVLSRRVRNAAVIVAPAAGATLAYMVYNKASSGFWLPLSGMQKISFALPGNVSLSLGLVSDFAVAIAARMLPMLVFMVVGATLAIIALSISRRTPGTASEREDRALWTFLVAPMSFYLLLKSSFLFSSVEWFGQGWWYYSGQIVVFNFLLAFGLFRLLAGRVALRRVAVVVAVLIALVRIADTGHRIAALEGYVRVYSDIWVHRDALNATLSAIDPGMKVIDNADGLYSFVLAMPVASATGLTFSSEELRDAKEKGRVRALVDRGFDVLPVPRDFQWLGHYLKLDQLDAHAELLYESPETRIDFYRLSY